MKQEKRNRQKSPNQKQPSEKKFEGTTLSIGELDIIFEINFTDSDLLNPDAKSDDKKYFQLDKMNSIKDLSFLSLKTPEFLNKIKLRPNNHLLRQLYLGNKVSKKKNLIELICYSLPNFQAEGEKFFQKIFFYVCLNYRLRINPTPLYHEGRYSLIIELKHNDESKKIILGKTPEEYLEEKAKEEKEKRKLEEEAENDVEEAENIERDKKKQEKIYEYKEERIRIKNEKIIEKTTQALYKSHNNSTYFTGNNQSTINNENLNKSLSKSKSKSKSKSPHNDKKNKKKLKKNKDLNDNSSYSDEESDDIDEDYDMNKAMKEKRIPKFKRKDSVLCNLSPLLLKYDLIFLNYEIIKNIPGNFKMKDFIELLFFFKKNKNLIFINFYKNELEENEMQYEQIKLDEISKRKQNKLEMAKKKEQEKQKNLEDIEKISKKINDLSNKKNDILENKKKEVMNMTKKRKIELLNNIETELENLREELTEKQDEQRAEMELEEEYKKIHEKKKILELNNQKKIDKKRFNILNEIFYLTDAYFFDTKQACDIFTKHYFLYTKAPEKATKINRQKLYDYFITVISRGRRPLVEGKKVGFFLDDFNKYFIIYTSEKKANQQELNPQPYPKSNPHNIDLIDRYKYILSTYKNYFYNIFISSAAHELSASHGIISSENIYPSYLNSLDVIKRQVECEKKGFNVINEGLLIKAKISERKMKKELDKLKIEDKEVGFVLDCTNKNKSALKDYVSLYDYNLKEFFSKENIRKNLENKGFINSEGYIMYDPLYKNVMGANNQNKKKYEEGELKSKIISSIENIDIPARLKDKEVNAKKVVEKQRMHIDKKIPFNKNKKTKEKV